MSSLLSENKPTPPEVKLTIVQRMVSATAGAVLTSLMVTPFDVIKTRLQAQVSESSLKLPNQKGLCPKCKHLILSNGLMEHYVPKQACLDWCESRVFSGTADAFVKIVRYEGATSLYNGLAPTLTMAIPATVLYFATFDKLNMKFKDMGLGTNASPVLAGSTARLIAASSIAPLELLRTKAQAIAHPTSMLNLARSEVRENGFRGLFRGLAPTLVRDIPFSAIYWVCVENMKIALDGSYDDTPTEKMSKALIAGASSGMIATVVTTPFDVIKTKVQTCPNTNSRPIWKISRDILRSDGSGAFFVGLAPRIAKTQRVPSCCLRTRARSVTLYKVKFRVPSEYRSFIFEPVLQ